MLFVLVHIVQTILSNIAEKDFERIASHLQPKNFDNCNFTSGKKSPKDLLMSSSLNEDDFCRFATAIMNVERNNKEDSTQEDNEIRSKYNDSLNMEQNQWNISQHIYDLLNVDESISKETFLTVFGS